MNEEVLALAFDYVELDGEKVFSFTIITGEPNPLASPIHDRMPCILEDDKIDAWLELASNGTDELVIYPSSLMQFHPVNPLINNPRLKDKSVIDALF